jgi:hypothetical protein
MTRNSRIKDFFFFFNKIENELHNVLYFVIVNIVKNILKVAYCIL